MEARAGKHVASAQADLSDKPRLWVVVQSYDFADLGVEITTYDERPLFG